MASPSSSRLAVKTPTSSVPSIAGDKRTVSGREEQLVVEMGLALARRTIQGDHSLSRRLDLDRLPVHPGIDPALVLESLWSEELEVFDSHEAGNGEGQAADAVRDARSSFEDPDGKGRVEALRPGCGGHAGGVSAYHEDAIRHGAQWMTSGVSLGSATTRGRSDA